MDRSRRKWFEAVYKAFVLSAMSPAMRGLAFGFEIDESAKASRATTRIENSAYRADAVVTLLGVPVFVRAAVGGAVASVREKIHDDQRTVALWFAGGSDPARTHGLHYAGSAEEISVEHRSRLIQTASFGFVTSSPSEETFEQARRRVADGLRERGLMVVVDESHQVNCVRFRKAFVPGPETPVGAFRQLARNMRSLFAGADAAERELTFAESEVPANFLYSMLAAVRAGNSSFITEYIHEGKRYQLNCEKARDARAGAALVAKNLVRSAASVIRLAGRIRELQTAKTSTFRLWVEDGADLPVRIEFSPRAYLRLSLEADPELMNLADFEENT